MGDESGLIVQVLGCFLYLLVFRATLGSCRKESNRLRVTMIVYTKILFNIIFSFFIIRVLLRNIILYLITLYPLL